MNVSFINIRKVPREMLKTSGFALGLVRKPSRGPNNCMFWAMTEAEGEVGIP